MAHHVALSHERPERPADHDGVLERERGDQRLDVVGHLRHGPPRRIARVRTAVCPVIGREHAIPSRREAVESREPDRAVEAGAAVEGDERPPLPALVDVELDVADGDAHQNAASRTPEAITRRMQAASTSR